MIRCLTVHARYACAHAGVCCRAGWPIPVEERLIEPLRLIGIDIGPDRHAPAHPDGQCVFFEAGEGRLCRIHRAGGPSLLPSVCRHFPRVVVVDPRGMSVTLSHFCPTAAGLLFEPGRLAIVEAPSSLALDGRLEGLDATGVLPPLLASGILTDWEGYSAWEEGAVSVFGDEAVEPECAVRVLDEATEGVAGWTPGGEPLAAAVRRAFAQAGARRRRSAGRWGSLAPAVNRFLAAHAFASWAAYDPDGLRSIVSAVGRALDVLTRHVEDSGSITRETVTGAMGRTDWELRHATAGTHS